MQIIILLSLHSFKDFGDWMVHTLATNLQFAVNNCARQYTWTLAVVV